MFEFFKKASVVRAVTNCLLVTRSGGTNPSSSPSTLGKGKEGKRGAGLALGEGGCVTEAEGSRGDTVGFVVFSLFISIYTACFVEMSETRLEK